MKKMGDDLGLKIWYTFCQTKLQITRQIYRKEI